jgi:pyruvate-formate lyase-activating enzyme
MLNETLIRFFKEFGSRNGASVSSYGSAYRCQLCQAKDHTAVAYPKHNDMWPKCDKCGGGHRHENYGIRCSFCNNMRHSEDHCWKKKDTKPSDSTTNYLEVLVNDKEATLIELNMICGANHHLSSGNMIPKRRLPMLTNEAKGITEQAEGIDVRDRTKEAIPKLGARSKILLHFMKG